MEICKGQTYAQSMKTVNLAAYKSMPLFRAEAFSIEDVEQEIVMRLLPHIPFEDPRILYTAAKRKALDFHRTVSGRSTTKLSTKERGNKKNFASFDKTLFEGEHGKQVSLLDLIGNKTVDPLTEVSTQDLIDWICSKLHGEDKFIFRCMLDEVKQKDIAQSLGVHESAVSQKWKQLKERIRIIYADHEKQKEEARINNRRPSDHVLLRTPDGNKVDRQRKAKRISRTR